MFMTSFMTYKFGKLLYICININVNVFKRKSGQLIEYINKIMYMYALPDMYYANNQLVEKSQYLIVKYDPIVRGVHTPMINGGRMFSLTGLSFKSLIFIETLSQLTPGKRNETNMN